MTWLKLSDDFSDDCARSGLSDAAFRTHVEALNWTMRRETGGWLSKRDVARFAETGNVDAAVEELVTAEFWRWDDGGWLVLHHMEHQPEPDLIAQRRRATAERVRRHRRKLAGLDDTGRNALHNAATERVTRDGTGRDGTGNTNTHQREELQAESGWPETADPGGAR